MSLRRKQKYEIYAVQRLKSLILCVYNISHLYYYNTEILMFCSVAGAAYIIVCIQHDGQRSRGTSIPQEKDRERYISVNCFQVVKFLFFSRNLRTVFYRFPS